MADRCQENGDYEHALPNNSGIEFDRRTNDREKLGSTTISRKVEFGRAFSR